MTLILEAAVKAAAIVALTAAPHVQPPGEPLPVREGLKRAPQSAPKAFPDPSGYQGPGRLTEAQAAAFLLEAGFPSSVVPEMIRIEIRESGLCPSAVYGYGCNVGGTVHGDAACGIAQIFPCPGPSALDPATNAALAFAKYQARGLAPWGG